MAQKIVVFEHYQLSLSTNLIHELLRISRLERNLTPAKRSEIMRMVVVTAMMERPTIIKVLRPAFSIKARETKVIPTLTQPMIRVATWASEVLKPADLKMEVE